MELVEGKKHRDNTAGRIFGACVLIGLGIGFIIDEVGEGVLIGVGVGFVVMGILKLMGK